MFAQHQLARVQPDGGGVHDLVGAFVLQHAVLVDARLVGKGIGPDDGLVGLDHHAGVAADHVAGAVDLLGDDVGVQVVDRLAGVDRHDRLFQAGVAGALADAIERDFDLPRAILHAGQRVGGGQPQVVVAVAGEDHILTAGYILTQIADQPAVLLGRDIAHGVGDVERGGAGLDGHGQHLHQEGRVAAPGVLRAELHVAAQAARVLHHVAHGLQHLVAAHAQLVLHVDVAGGQKGVDAGTHRALHRFPRLVDVVLVGARQAGDDRRRGNCAIFAAARLPPDRVGDAAHGFQVAGAGGGEARLHDVHAQPRQLVGDLQLLLDVEGGAGALLAVAQGGVEDLHDLAVGDGPGIGGDVVDAELFYVDRRRGIEVAFGDDGLFAVNIGWLAHGTSSWKVHRNVVGLGKSHNTAQDVDQKGQQDHRPFRSPPFRTRFARGELRGAKIDPRTAHRTR
jgi:hypothetical protein